MFTRAYFKISLLQNKYYTEAWNILYFSYETFHIVFHGGGRRSPFMLPCVNDISTTNRHVVTLRPRSLKILFFSRRVKSACSRVFTLYAQLSSTTFLGLQSKKKKSVSLFLSPLKGYLNIPFSFWLDWILPCFIHDLFIFVAGLQWVSLLTLALEEFPTIAIEDASAPCICV